MVIGGDVTSTAGQTITIDCNYTMIPNLITDPTIYWVNPANFIVSTTSTLLLSPLRTSHGGQYTCIVNIIIIELDISLTGNGITNVIVESKLSILYGIYCM